ncbi:MAG: UDP-N-acetylglucosamine--N-acetylmuramyl-(pentapeptide) pyrophosphoryl-undecaprenol N-acetylglucosamine transferase [Elusimicrobiota bacterium]
MRIVVACGGTGGHFYPGYALARVLRSRGHEVLFVLRRQDPAARRLDCEHLPYAELDLHGLPRRPSVRWLSALWKLAGSLRLARNIMRAYRPGVAVATGGYLSAPVALAARLCGVPYVLHESNAVLGLANRLCAGGAEAVALSLPLRGGPPRGVKTVVTGTPIREELWRRAGPARARLSLGLDPARRTLLVFGGSQGARALNEAAPEALKRFAGRHPDRLQVLHLSGPEHEGAVLAAYGKTAGPGSRGLRAAVRGSLDRMGPAFAAADLALCRAGASTVAELAAQRVPAVLVPYPSATAGHQEANARVLEAAGAAQVLLEPELNGENLAARLEKLLGEESAADLAAMAEAYGNLRLPEPSQSGRLLADVVEEAAKGYRTGEHA